ncbi:MAG: hypothetical protein COA79_20380 [Planctomycetota bacterium]|nr:MAG: hypothetical protein COA79_20380 [Planctomycetota bacterium]
MPNPNILRKAVLFTSGFDADAQRYFNAVVANGGALTADEKTFYNTWRVDSKNNANPWDPSAHIDLPMIGGTVESMVVNAKTPGTFDQIAVNTVAGDFTVNGFQPNGLDSYFRMVLIASTTLTLESIAMEFYSRTDSSDGTNIGAIVSTSQRVQWSIRDVSGNFVADVYNNNSSEGRLSFANADSLGDHVYARVSNTDARGFKDATQIGSNTTGGGSQPDIEFFLGAANSGGSAAGFDDKQCAGAGILDGLTAAQVQAMSNGRETFNVSLGRNL